MLEFGRHLRKLFAPLGVKPGLAVENVDWLELIGPDLLAREARNQCTEAGRVSCAQPFMGWRRGGLIWREHARRTGSADSVQRALNAAADAGRVARTADEISLAALDTTEGLMVRYDLCGGVATLSQAVTTAPDMGPGLRPGTQAMITAVQARLRGREARLGGGHEALIRAAALMGTAIEALDEHRGGSAEDLRLERAALMLEAGVICRDPHLLDQAGRELRRLVAAADPDRRPLSRGRALTLCAAGLSALATMARDEVAHAQARLLFDGAADQFTPDHSPLDWVAIQLARSASPCAVSSAVLRQAEALAGNQGLVLGALARDRRLEVETRAAETARDRDLVQTLREAILKRLSVVRRAAPARDASDAGDLDWAVDQIGLSRLDAAVNQLTNRNEHPASGFALFEAAEIARDRGLPDLAARAEALMPVRSINV